MYQKRRVPFLEIMQSSELDEIHALALDLLEGTGIEVHHDTAREILYSAGARVSDQRVTIPSYLVKRALSTAPERVVVANRKGERRLFLEKGRTYFGTGSDLKYTIDLNTRKKRLSSLLDIQQAALLCDHLPAIDFIMSYGLGSELHPRTAELHQFAAMIRNNASRPFLLTSFEADLATLHRLYQMAAVVAGGEEKLQQNPFIVLYGQFISPFVHNVEGLDRLLFCAEKRIPIIYIPTVMAGASGPVTMAGSLALANAEALAGLVISQLKSPGTPFIYGGCVMPFDMREAVIPYGAPEWAMGSTVLTQLAHRYQLPVFSTGGCSDSNFVDGQAAIEGTFSILMAALSGANLVHDVGYLQQGLAGSLEYLVMMEEVIGMSRRVLEGFPVNRESFAHDLIHQVGPGGHFTATEHTRKYFRETTWYPTLMRRKGGEEPMEERAREKAQQILSQVQAEPLPTGVEEALKEIMEEARVTER